MEAQVLSKIKDLDLLPRWACVAFAAQCARSAEVIFKTHWPSPATRNKWGNHDGENPFTVVSTAVEWTARTAEERTCSGHYGHCDDLESELFFLADLAKRLHLLPARNALESCRAALNSAGYISAPPRSEAAKHAAIAAAKLIAASKSSVVASHKATVIQDIERDYENLVNAARMERWTDNTPVLRGIFSPDSHIERQIAFAINDLCVELCKLIANNESALVHIEWRLLEQVVATALDGLGFEVHLTPSSKDGGKDVVATCVIRGRRATYYIEIKHWRSAKRVGINEVRYFVEVNVRDGTDAGLFLSTSGYAQAVISQLSEITKRRVMLGSTPAVISLCQHFVQGCGRAVWHPRDVLPTVLFEKTIQ